ncbi:hypothetical protein GCM10007968_28540 [Sporolactobacillus putidus]|uniref:Uncharacterized protein n=1 Tax=Sporolactobacillus putidus TaxID=492735 RepID=A0A917W4L5_9BACL|nr:hypothetical protein GCM10007968_28540 [Sporolactobacillus putidus]
MKKVLDVLNGLATLTVSAIIIREKLKADKNPRRIIPRGVSPSPLYLLYPSAEKL